MHIFGYLALTVIVTVDMVTCNIPPLLPYGPAAGDIQIAGRDDVRFSLALANPFVFYGTAYNRIFFSDNGGISFEDVSLFSKRPSLQFDYPAAILLYQNDHDSDGFNFFARESTATSDLDLAEAYVEELYPELAPYDAVSIAVVTWDGFPNFGQSQSITNTFQAVLVNAAVPVVLALYGQIDTIRGEVVIGITAGDDVQFEERPESRNSGAALRLDTSPQRPGLTIGLRGFIAVTVSDPIDEPEARSNKCRCKAKRAP